MFDKSLQFTEIKRIFEELGFRHGTVSPEEAKTPLAQIIFIHDRTDTLFAFPANTVIVNPARVESIRRILVGQGVVAEDVINDMLTKGPHKTVA